MGPALDYLELVFLTLLVAVAALALVAKRLNIAYPIMLVLGGLDVEPDSAYSAGFDGSERGVPGDFAATGIFGVISYVMARFSDEP